MRVVVPAVVLLVLAGLAAAFIPWRSWICPRVEPPAVATRDLQSSLARRIDERTQAVRDEPCSAPAWGALAAVFDVHEMFAEAITCYQRAHDLAPDEFRWSYFQGVCRLAGDQRQALVCFEQALAVRDDYAPLRARLAMGYLALDETDLAYRHFRRAAALDPSLVRAHLGLGEIALARGNADAAIEHLDRALALGPSGGEIHALLAEAHRRRGDLERAEGHLEQSIGGTPLEALPDLLRGELKWREGVTTRWRQHRARRFADDGEFDRAIAELEPALAEDPESTSVPANLGLLYDHAGRSDDAIALFEQVLEREPTRHRLRTDLGRLYLRRGDVELGLTELREACAAAPDDVRSRMTLAGGLGQAGRPGEAIDEYTRVVEVQPENARAHFERGRMLVAVDRIEEATAAFETAIAIEPARGSPHLSLAGALRETGRGAEAIAALRRGITHVPGEARLLNALAWMLATSPDPRLRDGAEAMQIADALCARTSYGEPTLLDTLAAAHADLGQFDEAIRRGEQALRLVRAAGVRPGPAGAGPLEDFAARLELYRRGEPFREAEGDRR